MGLFKAITTSAATLCIPVFAGAVLTYAATHPRQKDEGENQETNNNELLGEELAKPNEQNRQVIKKTIKLKLLQGLMKQLNFHF